MEPPIALERPNGLARTTRKKTRQRRSPPPQDARDWLTPNETALELGCSVATVHRLRRGLIPGIEPPPFCQYGRKIVFRKTSIARWRERNEKGGLAA
jgi:Helix-turn-helix domain